MRAGDAKGRESAKSNTPTVTLPVDTTPPAAPVVSVTGTTSSTVSLAWGPVADDDHTCCMYRVFANGNPVHVNGVFDGAGIGVDRWITYGRQTSNTFSVQAIDSAGNRSPTSSVTLHNQTC